MENYKVSVKERHKAWVGELRVTEKQEELSKEYIMKNNEPPLSVPFPPPSVLLSFNTKETK
jgi:hypothetical protein